MSLTAAGALPQQSKPERPNVDDDGPSENEPQDEAKKPTAAAVLHQPLTVTVLAPTTDAAAAAYRQVLERYLGRLTTSNHLPEALAVLRRELDRNPNDPLLYARLRRTFLPGRTTLQRKKSRSISKRLLDSTTRLSMIGWRAST